MTLHKYRIGIFASGAVAVSLATVALTWGGGLSLDLMLAVMWASHLVTGSWVLPFQPDWPGMALRVVLAVVAVVLAWCTRRAWRIADGRCGHCGRRGVLRDFGRLSRHLALASIVPSLGYAALKLHWAFGGTIGWNNPEALAGTTPMTPGFVDTAVLALVGIALICAMAYDWRYPPRWMKGAGGLIGSTMLLPVAAMGLIGAAASAGNAGQGDLATWVYAFVYSCFAGWGACLSVVTGAYLQRTRRPCQSCGHA